MMKATLERIQHVLSFGPCVHPHFIGPGSMGRIAVLATALTFIFTWSLASLYFTRSKIDASLVAWHTYLLTLSFFHLSEFYITLVRNPVVVSSTSFLVDHSAAYTAAFIGSCGEFWLRYLLLDGRVWVGGAGSDAGVGRVLQGVGW